MLTYMYHALGSFRSVFSRHRTWVLFVMVVLGFLGATEMIGVSSLCRFWGLDVPGYHSLLHFSAPPPGAWKGSWRTGPPWYSANKWRWWWQHARSSSGIIPMWPKTAAACQGW